MTTAEKVAYLKGLAEGFGIDPASHEGKLLATITDILEDLALDVQDIHDSMAELEEGLDVISEDLNDVEELLFDDEDDEEPADGLDELSGVYYEVECPACGKSVTFDEDVLARGAIECPQCGEKLEFDLGEQDGEAED